jgi:hypothetical protein
VRPTESQKLKRVNEKVMKIRARPASEHSPIYHHYRTPKYQYKQSIMT